MPPVISDLLQFDNYVFRAYVFWSGFLILKTGLMSMLPKFTRLHNRLFVNPKTEETEVQLNADLERVRSAHHNDLENILPILLVWFLYMLTDPNPVVAVNLMRVQVVFRLWHTFVYGIHPIRQPARSIGFAVPYGIMLYMAITVMVVFAV